VPEHADDGQMVKQHADGGHVLLGVAVGRQAVGPGSFQVVAYVGGTGARPATLLKAGEERAE
jgi:hypothetical protein